MSFDATAQFYDVIYAFKDYRAEAAQVAELVRALDPNFSKILDVACGTGEHARFLSEDGFAVDGLDLNPSFVQIAQAKNPTGRFLQGDMSAFAVPRRYDVVMCLFSSIGYLCTLERVAQALNRFRAHLLPGGALIVEPWLEPAVLDPTVVSRNVAEAEGVQITRLCRIELEGRISRLCFDYDITDASGTRHAEEVHELGLFTKAEMLEVFRASGYVASYDPVGPSNRGLYVARTLA